MFILGVLAALEGETREEEVTVVQGTGDLFFPLGSQLRCSEPYLLEGYPQDAIPLRSKDGRQGLNGSISDLAFIWSYPLLESGAWPLFFLK